MTTADCSYEIFMSGGGLRKKVYGRWVEISVQIDEIEQSKPPDYKLWFKALREMIYDYIGGETDEEFGDRYNHVDHEEAERWIFGDQLNDLSFDQIWRIIFENIDPGFVKKRLKLIFEQRFERFRNETKNPSGRRGSTSGNLNTARRRAGRDQWKSWLNNVICSSDDQGSGS